MSRWCWLWRERREGTSSYKREVASGEDVSLRFVVGQSLSHVWFCCDPMGCSLPGSSVHGIAQARTLGPVAVCCSRGSTQIWDWAVIAVIGRQVLYHWVRCLKHVSFDDGIDLPERERLKIAQKEKDNQRYYEVSENVEGQGIQITDGGVVPIIKEGQRMSQKGLVGCVGGWRKMPDLPPVWKIKKPLLERAWARVVFLGGEQVSVKARPWREYCRRGWEYRVVCWSCNESSGMKERAREIHKVISVLESWGPWDVVSQTFSLPTDLLHSLYPPNNSSSPGWWRIELLLGQALNFA